MLSVFDIFKIGIGPSSSHTVGPMRIAARVLGEAESDGCLDAIARVQVDLHGSLALTGVGHAVDKACILGLSGMEPETLDPKAADEMVSAVRAKGELKLGGARPIRFDAARDIRFRCEVIPQIHPNEMLVSLYDASDSMLYSATYYSVGGGFIASARQLTQPPENDIIALHSDPPLPFTSAAELLEACEETGKAIDAVVLTNEQAIRSDDEICRDLDHIWDVMRAAMDRGLTEHGALPGGLDLTRRAPLLYARLKSGIGANQKEELFDWLNVYAMAVNEENAAGGRVVTAPTNGAAGVIPAVLRFYCDHDEDCDRRKVRRFLLTAGGIGMLYKQRASISGAEMGCQGEVGVASSMAAAGLAAIWGGTPAQVEHAAEIGMEHHLGLTCDPVGGLVQIPCIERNAVGAVKAVNAARLALVAADKPKVSLDQVIETMRQTGLDMSSKYKETSEGGLAVNVVEC